jgi:arylsulfatase A-like enzyme
MSGRLGGAANDSLSDEDAIMLPTGMRCLLLALLLCLAGALPPAFGQAAKPNVVIIFADDLGYGDLSCFGHPTIATPNLDKLARQGQKWTQFYAAAPVCSPSRASLLTGRLPMRTGVGKNPTVFFEFSKGGMPQREITLAERLKKAGYATAHIGKWHLGHRKPYLPTSQGFDYYYGVPYSNDMSLDPNMALADDVTFRKGLDREKFRNLPHKYGQRVVPEKYMGWVPLMRNDKAIEVPVDQSTLTKRYAAESQKFIREQASTDEPFFLYYANNFPHIPLYASDAWRGKSRRGLYGDVVEELDHSVGQIIQTLKETGEADNTLVVFTSDNGPWLAFKTEGGSPGLLKRGKGTTWEGGMREPTIFWWPDEIEPGVVRELGSTLDLMPTLCNLAGVQPPQDRRLDGYDLTPVLKRKAESPRDRMFFYRVHRLYAARKGPYKAHFITQGRYGSQPKQPQQHDPPKLYHLGHDPREKFNIASQHPEILADIEAMVEQHRKTLP